MNVVCRYNQLLKQKVQLEELEKVLKVEQEKMLQQNEKHETVATEYKKLRDDNERYRETCCVCRRALSTCQDRLNKWCIISDHIS